MKPAGIKESVLSFSELNLVPSFVWLYSSNCLNTEFLLTLSGFTFSLDTWTLYPSAFTHLSVKLS